MRQHVPNVKRVVHQHQRGRKLQPARKTQPVENTPATPMSQLRQSLYERLFKDPQRHRAEHRHGQVANVAL